jgi:hypothetical protein
MDEGDTFDFIRRRAEIGHGGPQIRVLGVAAENGAGSIVQRFQQLHPQQSMVSWWQPKAARRSLELGSLLRL